MTLLGQAPLTITEHKALLASSHKAQGGGGKKTANVVSVYFYLTPSISINERFVLADVISSLFFCGNTVKS